MVHRAVMLQTRGVGSLDGQRRQKEQGLRDCKDNSNSVVRKQPQNRPANQQSAPANLQGMDITLRSCCGSPQPDQ